MPGVVADSSTYSKPAAGPSSRARTGLTTDDRRRVDVQPGRHDAGPDRDVERRRAGVLAAGRRHEQAPDAQRACRHRRRRRPPRRRPATRRPREVRVAGHHEVAGQHVVDDGRERLADRLGGGRGGERQRHRRWPAAPPRTRRRTRCAVSLLAAPLRTSRASSVRRSDWPPQYRTGASRATGQRDEAPGQRHCRELVAGLTGQQPAVDVPSDARGRTPRDQAWIGQTPSERPMISFMISVVPP